MVARKGRHAAVEVRVRQRGAVQLQGYAAAKCGMSRHHRRPRRPGRHIRTVGSTPLEAIQQVVEDVKVALAAVLRAGRRRGYGHAAAARGAGSAHAPTRLRPDLVDDARFLEDIVLEAGAGDDAVRVKLELHVLAEAARVVVRARLGVPRQSTEPRG